MPPRIFCFVALFVLMMFYPMDTQAKPANQSGPTVYVRVCYDNTSCRSPTDLNSNPTILDRYVEQVLANEWHVDADLQALKTGATAIRTFASRKPGCGAYLRDISEPAPIFGSRLLDNRSQRYRLGDRKDSPQNAITTNHSKAQSETEGIFFRRDSDNEFACAKYYTNTGNPTHSCSDDPSHSQCPNDSKWFSPAQPMVA